MMKTLECVILGVGAGDTSVYSKEPSSSFVLVADGKPVLLVDAGFGAVASCLQHVKTLPSNIYISHNHSDHSGELPVLLARESKTRSLRVYAHSDIVDVLLEHRLDELKSTGKALASFAEFVRLSVGEETHVLSEPPGGHLSIQLVQSQHSETCFGFLLLHDDEPILGWTADCGFNLEIYRWLACAPVLLIDARSTPSSEHAGFQDVDTLKDLPEFEGRRVYITGYGRLQDAPHKSRVLVAKPGDKLQLVPVLAPEPQTHDAYSYFGPGSFGWGLMDGAQRGMTRIKVDPKAAHAELV